MEPLGEALHFLRMSGTFYARSEFTAPWALALPAMTDSLMFHVVTSGRCWLEDEGAGRAAPTRRSRPRTPRRGSPLTSEPGIPAAGLFALPREQGSDRYEILRHGGGGAATGLVCGAVRFDHPAAHHLVAQLPRLISVEGWSTLEMDWIQSTVRFMAAEARELRPGGETGITRLADSWSFKLSDRGSSTNPAAQTGWLGALQDRQIGRAISLIHRDPARAWSLTSLAAEAGMSRSAFAARFKALVGQPAMHYAAQWRMHVALTWLREDGVAGRVRDGPVVRSLTPPAGRARTNPRPTVPDCRARPSPRPSRVRTRD